MHKGRREIDWSSIEISVKQIQSLSDPTKYPPWSPFSWAEGFKFNDVMASTPIAVDYDSCSNRKIWNLKETHYGRIRWLMENGWNDPILIESDRPFWIIGDGNHRLSAAILKKQKYILCECDGSITTIRKHFLQHVNYEKVSYLQ